MLEAIAAERKAEVMIHEVLHACWSVSNLPKSGVEEEQAVEALGIVLTTVIKNNPDLIAWLQAQLKDEP